MTHRAHGALAPTPQLHLGRQRGGCLHVCKNIGSLSHTADFPRQRRWRGGPHGHSAFPGSSQNAPAHGKLQGDERRDIAARGSSCRRSLWQRKRGPAQAGSPCYSAAKESEQVTSLQSPSCPTSLEHQFFTAKTAPPAQS